MKEKYFSSQLFKFKNSGTDKTAASIEMSLPRCSKSPSLSQLPTDSCGLPSHRGDLPVSLCAQASLQPLMKWSKHLYTVKLWVPTMFPAGKAQKEGSRRHIKTLWFILGNFKNFLTSQQYFLSFSLSFFKHKGTFSDWFFKNELDIFHNRSQWMHLSVEIKIAHV